MRSEPRREETIAVRLRDAIRACSGMRNLFGIANSRNQERIRTCRSESPSLSRLTASRANTCEKCIALVRLLKNTETSNCVSKGVSAWTKVFQLGIRHFVFSRRHQHRFFDRRPSVPRDSPRVRPAIRVSVRTRCYIQQSWSVKGSSRLCIHIRSSHLASPYAYICLGRS